jgi:hypothetical protein
MQCQLSLDRFLNKCEKKKPSIAMKEVLSDDQPCENEADRRKYLVAFSRSGSLKSYKAFHF